MKRVVSEQRLGYSQLYARMAHRICRRKEQLLFGMTIIADIRSRQSVYNIEHNAAPLLAQAVGSKRG